MVSRSKAQGGREREGGERAGSSVFIQPRCSETKISHGGRCQEVIRTCVLCVCPTHSVVSNGLQAWHYSGVNGREEAKKGLELV